MPTPAVSPCGRVGSLPRVPVCVERQCGLTMNGFGVVIPWILGGTTSGRVVSRTDRVAHRKDYRHVDNPWVEISILRWA